MPGCGGGGEVRPIVPQLLTRALLGGLLVLVTVVLSKVAVTVDRRWLTRRLGLARPPAAPGPAGAAQAATGSAQQATTGLRLGAVSGPGARQVLPTVTASTWHWQY